ncbi:hypothetical protein FRC03_011452 [Tulasnella sp. 419]|nr:hypothetical protein FRC03_011452 [Tulasnella sp. 419]
MATSSRQTRQSSASDYSGIDFSRLVIDDLVSQASSSKVSLNDDDYMPQSSPLFKRSSKRSNGSHDSLRLLAVSAQMTELSYALGDLESRIFAIQELRHRSLETNNTNGERHSTDSTESSGSVIDAALGQLESRLDTVSQSMATVAAAMQPFLSTVKTPTESKSPENDDELLIRKYGDLTSEWENLKSEAEVLRAELKEDKWLTIFRTVSEQADGMMESLEKIVRQCQDFIYQVHQRGRPSEESRPNSIFSERRPVSIGAFDDLLKSFEAKKKYYVPSTNKVISILDKGVRDRVTKNGECLRKHADLRARWRTLRDRISRIDVEMEKARKILVWIEHEGSEVESVTSEASLSLGPPTTGRSTRAPSSTSTSTSALARSISPFRKFAQKVTGSVKTPVGRSTPTQAGQSRSAEKLSVQPQTISRRSSFFPFRSPQPGQDTFQGKSKLSASTSSAPSVPLTATSSAFGDESTVESIGTPTRPPKPRWNSSTRPDNSDPPPLPPVPHHARRASGTVNPSPPRPPSAARYRSQTPSRPPTIQPPQSGNRRVSRTASRPTTPSNRHPLNNNGSPPTPSRPASRAHSSLGGAMATPRARPKTPSLIPTPHTKYLGVFGSSTSSHGSDDGLMPPTSILQRAFTPSPSISPSHPVNGSGTMHARRPSASRLPVPVFHASNSRAPSPAMSNYYSVSPSSSAAPSAVSSVIRPQTPDSSPRPKSRTHHQVSASIATSRPSLRPSSSKGPPSSFKESSSWTPPARTPPSSHTRTPSRAQSRAGAATPGADPKVPHLYIPTSPHDPLDNEIAKIVNSISHGLMFERVDPPLKSPPKSGEEVSAQYAVSNTLTRKTLPCRLRINTNRAGVESKKVMCRVGGGWMDLSTYLTSKANGAGL